MKRRRQRAITLTLVAFCVTLARPDLTARAQSADKLQLQLRLAEGESYGVRITIEQKISQTLFGQTQDIQQTTEMVYTFDVRGVDDDGNASLDCTYRSIRFEQDGPLGQVRYDSSDPGSAVDPIARSYASLIGKTFSLTLTPMGHATSVRGMDAILDQMMRDLGLSDDASTAPVREQLKSQFGDAALMRMMENMFAVYPTKPVGIGESWQRHVVVSSGFPMSLDNTWVLKDRTDGIARVGLHTVVSPNPEGSSLQIGEMTMSYDLSGEQNGTIEVEESTGWTRRAELRQSISGQIHLEGTPDMPQGMSWPVAVESTILMEKT